MLPECANSQLVSLLSGHVINIAFSRRGRSQSILNTLQAGSQQDCKRQIGIAGRIGGADLEAGSILFTRLISGNPDQV
jgi:phosphoheptose isomerase